MSSPIIGSSAVASGLLARGQLRWNHTAIHPDVYIPNGAERTLDLRTRAAALWVPGSVIAGRAVAALHGVRWVAATTPVELIGRARRRRERSSTGPRRGAMTDAGAGSPRESWLRLLLMDAGFPRPVTQIPVSDGYPTVFVDLGGDEPKIGLEYEGAHHQSDRRQFVRDIGRYDMFEELGWLMIRVVKEHGRGFILQRVHDAFSRRRLSLAKSAWGRDSGQSTAMVSISAGNDP
jgi:hypothetical protein